MEAASEVASEVEVGRLRVRGRRMHLPFFFDFLQQSVMFSPLARCATWRDPSSVLTCRRRSATAGCRLSAESSLTPSSSLRHTSFCSCVFVERRFRKNKGNPMTRTFRPQGRPKKTHVEHSYWQSPVSSFGCRYESRQRCTSTTQSRHSHPLSRYRSEL